MLTLGFMAYYKSKTTPFHAVQHVVGEKGSEFQLSLDNISEFLKGSVAEGSVLPNKPFRAVHFHVFDEKFVVRPGDWVVKTPSGNTVFVLPHAAYSAVFEVFEPASEVSDKTCPASCA